MKKAIVLSVLGIAASGMAAFGQGIIAFNNYVTSNYNTDQVLWGAGSGHSGTVQPGDTVTVQLLYQLGNQTSDTPIQFIAAATGGLSGAVSAAYNPTGAYGVGTYGYYSLGGQIISGWASGTVTFAVEAWDTSTGATYALATTKGISALFTGTDAVGIGPGIVSSSLPAHNFNIINGVTLTSAVPEPTTMALGGLGLAALMLFRRKQV
jgi:hypothetical protein